MPSDPPSASSSATDAAVDEPPPTRAAPRRDDWRGRATEVGRRAWRALNQHGPGRWLVLGGAVGALCGVAGFVFELLTNLLSRYALGGLVGYMPTTVHGPLPWVIDEHVRLWAIAPVVALGGALTGLVLTRFANEAAGGGTGKAVAAYHHQRGLIPIRVTLTKMVASVLTLGSGGSGGREGPIALVGAGFASWFAQRARLTVRERRVLVMAGVAGGVAAVFRAPLAAALFACEVLYQGADLEADALIPSFVSSIVGFTISGMLDAGFWSLFGQSREVTQGLFARPPTASFAIGDWPQLIGYALVALGVAIGSRLLVAAMTAVERACASFRLPLWLKIGAGGLVTGAIAVLSYEFAARVAGLSDARPALSILGSGYRILQHVFAAGSVGGGALAITLAVVALAKIAATASSIGSGGSGGLFAPSLVIGGCVGGAIGLALAGTPIGPPPIACLLIGMAAFLCATHRTPVAAILMVSEISGTYALLIPAMWACGIAFSLMGRRTLIGSQVGSPHESPAHRGHHLRELLAGTPAREALDPARACASLRLQSTLADCRAAARSTSQSVFPVLDDDGRFHGILTRDDLHGVMLDQTADAMVLAADLVSGGGVAARADEDIPTALRRLGQHHLDELPLLDAEHRLLGLLTRAELTDAYRRAVERLTSEADDERRTTRTWRSL